VAEVSEHTFRILWRAVGFLAVTLIAVSIGHLAKHPSPGELVDAVVSSLVFTAAFALGGFLGRQSRRSASPAFSHSPKLEVLVGAVAAGVVQLIIWIYWLSIPIERRHEFGEWPLFVHLGIAAFLGLIASSLRIGWKRNS
jgi:hypothetical protein